MSTIPPSRAPLPDHASEADERAVPIDRVGVRGLSYPIKVLDRAHGFQHTVARFGAFVGLPAEQKGTHMSRLVEVLDQVRGEVTIRSLPTILSRIQERLQAEDAHVEVTFPYFLVRQAPVSGAESLMDYQCRFEASVRGDVLDFVLGVQVPVTSLCPCSKAISDRGAHNQRSVVDVAIRAHDFVWIEDLVAAVEGAASAPLFALLKREDEKYVTELAYDRPRFVEDLVREVLLSIQALPSVHWISVAADNQESIHNHSAFAQLAWSSANPPPSSLPRLEKKVTRFGAWLRETRLSRRLSQGDLAHRLNVGSSYLCRVEADEKPPSPELLEGLAAVLGLELALLELRAGRPSEALIARLARHPERVMELLAQLG